MGTYEKKEFIIKFVLYILAAIIIIKMMVPLIKPAIAATESSELNKNFYEAVLTKSFPYIEATEDSDDDYIEDRKGMLSVLFKYITNIDISNPKSYIASQIPILSVLDITSAIGNDDKPVVIKPINVGSNNNAKPDSGNSSTTGAVSNVEPDNLINVKPQTLNLANPQVLIFHTHATESFDPDTNDQGKYNFSLDSNVNMCRVGEEMKNELQNKYGIACLHDVTYHDVPKREGGYAKAKPTIQKYLKQYPNLKIIIDLHRDGDVPKKSATAVMNNVSFARVMFVVGTKNPNYKKNESLVNSLCSIMQSHYPNFCRGVDYQSTRYNEDLSEKIVLLEVGTNLNTLQEAINTGKLFAGVVAEKLK